MTIKQIPTEIDEKEIEDELKQEGYPTVNVKRMNGKRGTPIQMALVEIERKYKSLYDKKKHFGLNIALEPLKPKNTFNATGVNYLDIYKETATRNSNA